MFQFSIYLFKARLSLNVLILTEMFLICIYYFIKQLIFYSCALLTSIYLYSVHFYSEYKFSTLLGLFYGYSYETSINLDD